MPAQTILYRMPNGAPGAVSRLEHSTLEAGFLKQNTRAAVGLEIEAATGKFIPVTSAANLYGILSRSYPDMSANDTSFDTYNNQTNMAAPVMMSNRSVGILRSGYMTVPFEGSAPCKKGDKVYVSTAAAGNIPQGAFVDSGSGGAPVAINATYNGPALPSEVVEIIYNI